MRSSSTYTTYGEQKKVTLNLRVIGDNVLSANPEWQEKQNAPDISSAATASASARKIPPCWPRSTRPLDDMDKDGVRQKIPEKYGLWDESLSREAMMSK